jgi:hypothetical protein
MPVHKGEDCVGQEMGLFHKGRLHSGKSGKVVTDPRQAKAIALSACGESRYAEVLLSLGFSEETASLVVEMFAESFLKKAKSSVSSPSFEEMDWQQQFETGKSPAKENPENYHTGMTTKKGRGQLRIGKGPGDMGKLKVNNDSEMLAPVSYPKGPGNPQGGSSKDVQGMRMLG